MDIRWKQRFQHFEKAFMLLKQALELEEPDIFQQAGLIQFFEMNYELAWKMLKDYLQLEGFEEINSPRSAIKKAFETGVIKDGVSWLKLLDDRNLTTHAYEEEEVKRIDSLIRNKYFRLLQELYETFKQKGDD